MVSDAKDTSLVAFDDGGHVAVLTLKSPSSRNALSLTMLEALSRQFAVISRRDDFASSCCKPKARLSARGTI